MLVSRHQVPALLARHLDEWAGWPPERPVRVVANKRRAAPGWDGSITPLAGVVTDTGAAVLGIDPAHVDGVRDFVVGGPELKDVLAAAPALMGVDGVIGRGSFRWTQTPAPLPDAGEWVEVGDPRVPKWLHPFGGEVLIALDSGRYVAGVGIKKHDEFGHELAVVTEEAARGRGLARRLVAQAARRVIAQGAVPTYLHAPDNAASARVAEAAGFVDRGWEVLGFFSTPPSAP